MSDEWNWSALETIGVFLTGIGSGIVAGVSVVVRWFRGQRSAILKQIADLRESHERHVMSMQKAHNENANRLVRLEAQEEHMQNRLDELVQMMRDMKNDNRRQTELLINLNQQWRK